jgi:hypothetical protein
MKVFVSWSGESSKQIAELLKRWLEDVQQGCSVWVSSEDIEKGSIWFNQIADSLKDTGFGILCLNRANLESPWILFEAGALSKGLSSSRVTPFLIDITSTDLTPPLSLLNATTPSERDMLKLVKEINAQGGDAKLSGERLDRSFTRCWPEFERDFKKLVAVSELKKTVTKRNDRELLEELVNLSRSIYRMLADSVHTVPIESPQGSGHGVSRFTASDLKNLMIVPKSAQSPIADGLVADMQKVARRLEAEQTDWTKEIQATMEKYRGEAEAVEAVLKKNLEENQAIYAALAQNMKENAAFVQGEVKGESVGKKRALSVPKDVPK